jgi:hypothetical protein
MTIIGQSIGILEEITTDRAASSTHAATGAGENLWIRRVGLPPRSTTDAIPLRVGTTPPEEKRTSRAARMALEGGSWSALAVVDIGEVWKSLPQDTAGKLRQRLLVVARRVQKVRHHS